MYISIKRNALTFASWKRSERYIALSSFHTALFFFSLFSHFSLTLSLSLPYTYHTDTHSHQGQHTMPRAKSLHPSTKVTQSLSKTNSRPKSVLVTPPTPTPVKRGRRRPPKIPKVISADLTPKVPTPESSDGEYQPEDHIIGT